MNVAMFYLIGLGLSSKKDITVRGLEIVKKCERVYLEHYTSILMSASKEDLESYYGKEVILADRELVESESDAILKDGKTTDIAFLVVGDVFGATTHTDLVIRARELGIKVESVHNASIMNAVGACGLQLYNFGQTVSLVFFTETWKPDSFYPKIEANVKNRLHTLVLLDIKVKEQSIENIIKGNKIYEAPRYMSVSTAASQLLEVLESKSQPAYNGDSVCIAVSRLGAPDQGIKVATLQSLATFDAGEPLHSLVIVGSEVHELEVQYMSEYFDGTFEELLGLCGLAQ